MSFFSTAADRINMLHPALADGTNTGPKPFGVSLDLPANLINQWIPGGSSTVPNNFVTLGAMATAPDGSNTAQKIVEASTNQPHSLVAGTIVNSPLTWGFIRLRLAVF